MAICIQACLKEIHNKMLRKHLGRLEHLDGSFNRDMERDKTASPKVDQESDHDLQGIDNCNYLNNISPRVEVICYSYNPINVLICFMFQLK